MSQAVKEAYEEKRMPAALSWDTTSLPASSPCVSWRKQAHQTKLSRHTKDAVAFE
jgi:hypothetical protein